MKNKGFTLMELLGVIVILSLLMIIVLPNIVNSVRNSSSKTDDATLKLIYDAANLYVSYDNESFPEENGNKYVIALSELVNQNMLKSPITLSDSNDDITNTKCVQVTYDNGYKYELKNNGECSKRYLSKPDLYDNTLTPVKYNGTNWVVASESEKWYDYDNQQWANAVILKSGVSKTPGTVINVDGFNSDVYAMYVWIPRYEYKMSDAASTSVTEIHINFISRNTTTPSEGYKINSGFTFGNTNLSGIWVGKFETSHATLSSSTTNNNLGCTNENCANADNLRIVPNVQSLRRNNISKMFYASRSMGRNGNPFGIDASITDSHMMKSSEWGIVAYLSLSKYGKYGNSNYTGANKEVYINNSSGYYTGRSGGGPSGSTPTNETYTSEESTAKNNTYGFYTYDDYLLEYNTNNKTIKVASKGTGASTTGNIYGVYDMSGGAYEYAMGVFANSSGELWSGNSTTYNSGFTGKLGTSGEDYTGVAFPNSKYYDVYKASSGTTMTTSLACNGGICYGHAVQPEVASWYGDYTGFVSATYPWFQRGGISIDSAVAGIMRRNGYYGSWIDNNSFRLVLSEA